MPIRRFLVPLTAAAVAMVLCGGAARADLLIEIDKSTQRMTVTVDGQQRYEWPVSTGADGYDTPSGEFKPFRMEIDHKSDEYEQAPMPYAIFFTMTGNAVHGTPYERALGHAVSHGCVRLSLKNAATLWALVKQQKMAKTAVVVTGEIPDEAPSAAAPARPKPIAANAQRPRAPAAPSLFSLFDH
jgi:hypothetical protein